MAKISGRPRWTWAATPWRTSGCGSASAPRWKATREDARYYFVQAVRTDLDFARAWLYLGGVADDPALTLSCVQKVLRLDPSEPQARAGLVWARDKLGLLQPLLPLLPSLSQVDLLPQPAMEAPPPLKGHLKRHRRRPRAPCSGATARPPAVLPAIATPPPARRPVPGRCPAAAPPPGRRARAGTRGRGRATTARRLVRRGARAGGGRQPRPGALLLPARRSPPTRATRAPGSTWAAWPNDPRRRWPAWSGCCARSREPRGAGRRRLGRAPSWASMPGPTLVAGRRALRGRCAAAYSRRAARPLQWRAGMGSGPLPAPDGAPT